MNAHGITVDRIIHSERAAGYQRSDAIAPILLWSSEQFDGYVRFEAERHDLDLSDCDWCAWVPLHYPSSYIGPLDGDSFGCCKKVAIEYPEGGWLVFGFHA